MVEIIDTPVEMSDGELDCTDGGVVSAEVSFPADDFPPQAGEVTIIKRNKIAINFK